MKLNELMHRYLGEQVSERDPLQNIVPQDLIMESNELPVEVIESKWEIKGSPERMIRVFHFNDLTTRNWFLAEVLENEKSNHHFGKILVEGMDVKVEVQTHDINRVTELDQEYAAYCDDIWGDVEFIGRTQAWET